MSVQKQRSTAVKSSKRSSRPAEQFRIGKVQGYLRGSVWYLYYHEQGHRRRPRVGPDLEIARQLAAQINGQLENGAPAALSFEPISLEALRDRWLSAAAPFRCLATSALRSAAFASAILNTRNARWHRLLVSAVGFQITMRSYFFQS